MMNDLNDLNGFRLENCKMVKREVEITQEFCESKHFDEIYIDLFNSSTCGCTKKEDV